MAEPPKHPCPECPFLTTVTPGALGGGTIERFVGQAAGPFYIPCHMHIPYTTPGWTAHAIELPHCIGALNFRANTGLDQRFAPTLPLPRGEKDPRIFASCADFARHHGAAEARAQDFTRLSVVDHCCQVEMAMVARGEMHQPEIRVLNLATQETLVYQGIGPERAVIAAYAQSRRDFNTWDYAKYAPLLVRGQRTISCGDWCALLPTPHAD